jgi:hypothetical protein
MIMVCGDAQRGPGRVPPGQVGRNGRARARCEGGGAPSERQWGAFAYLTTRTVTQAEDNSLVGAISWGRILSNIVLTDLYAQK